MWVSFLHLPRTRYYEEGGNYSDDFRGGGGDGGAVVRRRMGMRPMGKTSDLDGLASTMSFMQRKIRCGSRSTAKKIVKLLKKGVLITRSNEKETGRSSSMKYNNNKKKNRILLFKNRKIIVTEMYPKVKQKKRIGQVKKKRMEERKVREAV